MLNSNSGDLIRKAQSSKTSLFSSRSRLKPSNFSDDTSDNETDSYEENGKNASHDSNSAQKISLKDLCDEDKLRIANLVKELAKYADFKCTSLITWGETKNLLNFFLTRRISEEKAKVEQSLEVERKQKDTEIKEILKQQESLLSDKETLLNKFSKVQQKLEHLKKRQTRKPNADDGSSNNSLLPPRPLKLSQHKAAHTHEQNDSFSPFKSSTPKNLSPRSLSPINACTTSNENNDQHEKLNHSIFLPSKDRHGEDLKKIELIKQRMELMEEQKKLTQLLDQQEEMLKEKQVRIKI